MFILNKNVHSPLDLVTTFQFLSVRVSKIYALTPLEDSTKFGRDEKGIQHSQQFECEASLISNIREVFSVLANQHLIIRNVLTESESSLTREAIKMNIGE